MPPKPRQPSTKIDKKRTSGKVQGKMTRKKLKDFKSFDEDEVNIVYKKDNISDSESLNSDVDSEVQTSPSKKGKSQMKATSKQKQKNQRLEQVIEAVESSITNDEEQSLEMINTSSSKRRAACDAKKKITKVAQYTMEAQSQPERFDPVVEDLDYKPPIEEGKIMDTTSDKSSKSNKNYAMSVENANFIQTMSNNFKMQFGDLKLRNYECFKNLSTDSYKAVKIWYRNRSRGFVKPKTSQTYKIPAVEFPNVMLMNLLNDDVAPEHKAYIAQILETHLPPQLQSYYTNLALQTILKDVENSSDDISELVRVLQNAPLHLRLKATASAIQLLEDRKSFTNNHRLSWFSHCIKPSLTIASRINYMDFTTKEVQVIKDICEFCNPYQFNDDEAYAYLKLLKHGNVLDLDETRKHFLTHSSDSWKRILSDICGIPKEIAEIWTQHKSQMVTDALFQHYKVFNMSKEFAHIVSLFHKLSSEDISELYQLSHQRGFTMLVNLLTKQKQHDFQLFKIQADVYMKLENPAQLESCAHYLSKAPVEDWGKYKNQILASSAIIDGGAAMAVVQQTIIQMQNQYRLPLINEKNRTTSGARWDDAFKAMNEKIILQKFEWQKELGINLLELIETQAKKNVIVTLCTGHGKSVIIQLLADMLARGHKVIVVCMNDFLANWARQTYGSLNVRDRQVIYMSIFDFLKMIPDKETYAVFDEIDSMLGTSSCNVIENGQSIKVIYNASLMRQWKTVIGFSGTIARSTIDQLVAELKDPVCIDIPSLRTHGTNNKVIGVIKTTSQDNLFNSITTRIHERLPQNENFIVVFEDAKTLQAYRKTSAFLTAQEKRTCITFDDFSQNFAQIEQNLYEVSKDNFIVLTTKEGARGIDYKGINPAHVIMAFNPKSYSECVQALGRGCRELTSFAEGTIICNDPLTTQPINYLTLLLSADSELSEAMVINCKIARVFHEQFFDTSCVMDAEIRQQSQDINTLQPQNFVNPYFVILTFGALIKQGLNIKKVKNGTELWEALKYIDANRLLDDKSKMPEDFYQRWDQ